MSGLEISYNEEDFDSDSNSKNVPSMPSKFCPVNDRQLTTVDASKSLIPVSDAELLGDDEEEEAEETTVAKPAKTAKKTKDGRIAKAAIPINADDPSPVDQIIILEKRKTPRTSDEKIAKMIRDQGLADYAGKTIGTRWARLRAKMVLQNDKRLDAGEISWTSQQDQKLVEAHKRAKIQLSKAIAELDSKFWNMVASQLADTDRANLFSHNAVRERYEQIIYGADDWYPELVDSETRVAAVEQLSLFQEEKDMLKKKELAADEEMIAVIKEHLNDVHEAAVRKKKISASEIYQQVPESADDEASLSAMDPQLNGLPSSVNRAARQEKSIKQAFDALSKIELPPIKLMNRAELGAELKARGFQDNGKMDDCRSLLRRARKGETEMPKIVDPAQVEPYKALLSKKKVWVFKEASPEEEESCAGDATKQKKMKGGKAAAHNPFANKTKQMSGLNTVDKSLEKILSRHKRSRPDEENDDIEESSKPVSYHGSSAKVKNNGHTSKKARVSKEDVEEGEVEEEEKSQTSHEDSMELPEFE